jgi:PleD family two-component response regulator
MNELILMIKKNAELQVLDITVSIGMTEVIDNDDPSSMYKRADNALYMSKNNGKNDLNIL